MKALDLSFCEHLVYSDFCLITNVRNTRYRRLENFITWNKKQIFSIEILQLFTELRLLIKLIESLKIKKFKKDKLIISAKFSDDIFLLIAYLKEYFCEYNILVSELSRINELKDNKTLKVALISFFSCSKSIQKSLNFNKIFLVSVIDIDDKIQKESSIYKIYNKLDSFRKSLFFIAFLETIFKMEESEELC